MDTLFAKKILEDVNVLKNDFRRMGELVRRGLADSMDALTENDRTKAYGVILRDFEVDFLESQVDKHCLQFLLRHSAAASNLRFVYSTAKMSADVERVGDYAESIARHALELSHLPSHPIVARIREMSVPAFRMFEQALRAFSDFDPLLASETLGLDNEVDLMEKGIYDELMRSGAPNPSSAPEVRRLFLLLNISARIERVADQACNICEEVVYITTGKVLKHHGQRGFRVLFVSPEDSCRSKMAEAVARKMVEGHAVSIESAGGNPARALTPGLRTLLNAKGFSATPEPPRAIDAVGPLNVFDVIVSFSERLPFETPRLPDRTLIFTWDVGDPAKIPVEDARARKSALEATFAAIEVQVRELFSALLFSEPFRAPSRDGALV